ncbi:MAG: alkaline phosphatase family protein [Elusimicrobia bacterium]|nr:alkaline phosphatase family protein [Elusimicrobiota bacterium]
MDEAYIPRNIILIGWDGVDREAAKELLSAWELPNLKQLMAGGTSFDIYDEESEVPGAGRPELPAGSPRMAGAAGGYTRQAIPAGPDIFKSIKRSDPSIKTVMVAESQSFYAGTVDVREQVRPGASSLAAEKAVDLLTKYAAGRIFAVFQFDEPARARERYGSGSPEYRQAIVSSDAALGTLVSALKILGIYDDTLVYVVAGLEPGFLRAGQRSPP